MDDAVACADVRFDDVSVVNAHTAVTDCMCKRIRL